MQECYFFIILFISNTFINNTSKQCKWKTCWVPSITAKNPHITITPFLLTSTFFLYELSSYMNYPLPPFLQENLDHHLLFFSDNLNPRGFITWPPRIIHNLVKYLRWNYFPKKIHLIYLTGFSILLKSVWRKYVTFSYFEKMKEMWMMFSQF